MSIAPINRVSAQQTQLNKIGSHSTQGKPQADDDKHPSTSQLADNRIHLNSHKTFNQFERLSEQARDHFFAQAEIASLSKIESNERSTRATKAELTQSLQTLFAAAASNSTHFNSLLAQSFGDNYNAESAETIRQQSVNGDFTWMPNIRIVNAQLLADNSGAQRNGIGSGAYSAKTDTIYLNQQLMDGDFNQALTVLIEETGHALDVRINTSDTAGDEGAVFAHLLLGECISSEQLSMLQADNDHGSIIVDGNDIEVEFSILSKALGKAGNFIDDKIVQPIKKETQRVGRQIDDSVIQPIKKETKRLGSRIDDNILQPIKESVQVVARGAEALIKATLIRPVQEIWRGAKGYANTVSHLLKGDFKEAWNSFADTTVNGLTATVRIPLEQCAIILHTTLSAIDTLRGDFVVRKLDATEITYLQGIYGESIDYSEVRIHSGGFKEQLGLRANVIGNDIFMPQEDADGLAIFNADGTMTQDGLSLLGHEAAHVWQYQNNGTAYIGDSLLAQINHSLFKDLTGVSSPYDWYSDVASGVEFKDLGPEQQAEVAAIIGDAIVLNESDAVRDPNVPFTDENLAEAIGIKPVSLPIGVYDIFLRAYSVLRY